MKFPQQDIEGSGHLFFRYIQLYVLSLTFTFKKIIKRKISIFPAISLQINKPIINHMSEASPKKQRLFLTVIVLVKENQLSKIKYTSLLRRQSFNTQGINQHTGATQTNSTWFLDLRAHGLHIDGVKNFK